MALSARKPGAGCSDPAGGGQMPAARAAADADVARTCYDLLVEDKWTPEQACGILGNIQHESGFDLAAPGDGGTAYGLAQWHPDRQRAFARKFGRPIHGSSLEEQIHFITFEMNEGTETAAGKLLHLAKTPESAADVVCRKYERPADKDGGSRKRSQTARAFFDAFSANLPSPPPPPEPLAPATSNVMSPARSWI